MNTLIRNLSLTLLLALIGIVPVRAQESLQSPDQYLGYVLGEQWTPHYKVLGYFRHVADHSPMVELQQYGTTNEGRELVIAKIASEANMARMEEIRTDNLKRAGMLEGEPNGEPTPIVWLSYNVHGNETSSSEAAMKTIYELVRPGNSESKQWLENTVVIMDPMINPDGRDRYVHWFKETAGDEINADVDAREHHEPWPGGRTNHYYFDLNRDWAWLTQKESRQRIEVYQQWLPHIHVDYHEQSYNDPYYFAPAAKPFHTAITDWQEEFQYTIGKNHARYFDRNDWLYFTREVFDLFYPSYGDTYPIFNGAIGMTYEQGGGGAGGLAVVQADGDTLRLNDRLTHHYTTGMSTVEITSQHAERVVQEFTDYYQNARNNPAGKYKSYVIKPDNSKRLQDMFGLLDKHKVRYGVAREGGTYRGYNYRTGSTDRVRVEEGDYIVSAYQPKSTLARIFFEPDPELTDSLTYDITAWSLPYAYGLEAYALEERVEGTPTTFEEISTVNDYDGTPYAYLADWNSQADVRFLAQLIKKGVKIRYSTTPFVIDGRSYDRGSLVITRKGNKQLGEKFDHIVQQTATELGEKVYAVNTGFVEEGSDFGSGAISFIDPPRVALLSGEGTSSGMVGEVWHFFDRQIDYPVTMIDTGDFGRVDLAQFDVLILPSGFYRDALNDQRMEDIREWIRDGGRLIALGGANGMLAGKEGFSLKRKDSNDEEEEVSPEDKLDIYGERQRESVQQFNAGSIFRTTMDNTHPLGFGYGDDYFSLKLSSSAYQYLDSGWNVGVARKGAHTSGFIGHKAEEQLANTLTFGVQNMGGGEVVYIVDNPLFRAFWYNGKLLFGNAVFIVGQ